MSMKKFLTLLSVSTVVLTIACGGGSEVADSDEGVDDQAKPAVVEGSTAGGATAAPAAATAAVDPNAATVAGLVKFEGTAANMGILQMSADSFCASQHPAPVKDEEVVVSPAGELANVLVYVKDIAGNYPPPATSVLVDQRGCQYHPHVNAVQVGQKIDIKNSDQTLHNVHAMPTVNSAFNEGQPVPMVSTKKFDKVEMTPFKIKCDVHGWMKSYMAVLPHPFWGVSQMNGTFNIANLPPGTYTLVAWHEKYGSQEQPITVGAKEQKQVTFTFKG
jgi:plastocyanin